MDVKSVVSTVLILALIGFLLIYAQRFSAKLAVKASI